MRCVDAPLGLLVIVHAASAMLEALFIAETTHSRVRLLISSLALIVMYSVAYAGVYTNFLKPDWFQGMFDIFGEVC